MKAYAFDGVGVSEYFFGKRLESTKRDDETHAQFDARCWREKVNVTEDGQCFISQFALKNGLESAGKRLQLKVPGMGKSTFTKLFTQGLLCFEPLLMELDGKPITLDDVKPRVMFVPSDGKHLSKQGRVDKTFPVLTKWGFHATMIVADDKITIDILARHLEEMSKYIGFGAMRVESGGINGRWAMSNLQEVEMK